MQVLNVHEGKRGAHVTPAKYEATREAMLAALPTGDSWLTWDEMVDAMAPLLPEGMFKHLGSVRWYAKSVQLDLEARGLIERDAKSKRLRIHRVAAPASEGM